MINEPIYKGILQSDLDCDGYDLLNFSGGGGGGTSLPPGWVSVKAAPYNAAGDGVTDDTVAIQTALNHINTLPGGGTLFFPPGAYLCNGNFDPTTNSILKIPYNDIGSGIITKTIALRGSDDGTWGVVIMTTRTDGSGVYPALLAANAPAGIPADELNTGSFSNQVAVIKDINFVVPANPTMCGVRMDTIAVARLENVLIEAAGWSSQPSHDVVGLWMPDGGNFSDCRATNVRINGFWTGFFISEHFIGSNLTAFQCRVALATLVGYQTAQVNLNSFWCPTAIQNRGIHLPVQILARMEDSDMAAAAAWSALIRHVDDASNTIWGTMDYIRVHEPEREHSDIILNGAGNLRMFNMYTQTTNFLRIGDDLRLVPITGGGKLQARNPGTNTWADVDQWTNP